MNEMEPIFTSRLIQACVTCIRVEDDFIIAGIGGNVHIYNVITETFLRRFKIFEGSKIHGIEFNKEDKQIFIYSGQKMKLIKYEGDFEKFSREPSSLAQDWILAAKFIDNNSRIATVSMNNLVQFRNMALEVIEEYSCTEKSMLYSAAIGYKLFDELEIFAGTAFGSLLFWRPSVHNDKKCSVLETLKGHKGVVLSVDFHEQHEMVCTTSDDRSSILWGRENFKKKFEKKCKVYGHQARVFCCKVVDSCFFTAGEDSVLNIWSYEGYLLRSIEPHQGGAIRSIGYHKQKSYVVSGGEDGSLTAFKAFTFVEAKKMDMPKMEVPRQIVLLASGNILVMSECGHLLYYKLMDFVWVAVDHHKQMEQSSLLEVSPCRKCVAVIGFHGEMHFYKEIKSTVVKKCSFKLDTQSKIAGAYWLNCKNFLTHENDGRVFTWDVQKNAVEVKYQYTLPWNGERRLTAACLHKECLVIGDRKGHLHVYNDKKEFPIRSMMKVHSSQGVSKLYSISNVVVSLGRDSLLKMHRLERDLRLTPVSADKLPFNWLGSLYKNYLLGFSGEYLVLWDIKTRRTLLKSPCGGGHRSWDFSDQGFVYLKSKAINIKLFKISSILPLDFISGYHVKEINCMKALRIGGCYILISGGEDTVLRIKKVDLTKERVELCSIKKFKSHLSSIKTIALHKVDEAEDKLTYLIFYGGGREQILMYKLQIGIDNPDLVSCMEQDSYYNNSNDVETRIMDINVVEYNKRILLFAACSNGNIHLFKIVRGENPDQYVLKFMKTFKYKMRCLLKISSLVTGNIKLLLTMATDGLLVFWNFNEILNSETPTFFDSVPAHQSGINSYSIKTLSDTRLLILTGGDDNAVVLNLIDITSTDTLKVNVVDTFKDIGVHCALISGAFICDKFFVTTSIDQRVLLFGWEIIEEKLKCRCVSMFHTAIADVQGMDCFNNGRLDLFIYGNGLEYLTSRRILSG